MNKLTQSKQSTINRQRESILRFYASMTNRPYDDVLNEYFGKTTEINFSNRLYQTTEAAVHYMNEELNNVNPTN